MSTHEDPIGPEETIAMTHTAAARWSDALAAWAIPKEILDQAPEPPWSFSPKIFAGVAESALASAEQSVSRRVALEVLPEGGSVLDVGAGGGAASLPLAPPAGLLVGVDSGPGMLEVFAAAADRRGVAHLEVEGTWPAVAGQVEPADVVVSHNVLYNVADAVPFLAALGDHARRRAIVEIGVDHPTSNLNPYWLALHGIERPTTPTADDLLAVLTEMGLDVHHERATRRWARPEVERAEQVAGIRRRLCVGPERDPEIEALLDTQDDRPVREAVTFWWDPRSTM